MSGHVFSIHRMTLIIIAFTTATLGNTCMLTSTTLWASGVSVDSTARIFADYADIQSKSFDVAIGTSIMKLQTSDEVAPSSISDFYDSYKVASRDYSVSVQSAASVYHDSRLHDPLSAKAIYIDNIKHANASFLSMVSNAKNQLLSEVISPHMFALRNAFTAQFDQATDAFNQSTTTAIFQLISLS